MATYKVIDADQLDADMSGVADSIRAKGGTTEQLAWPDGYKAAIEAIQSGGGAALVEFSQVNPVVAEYLANVSYGSDYSTSQVATYANRTTDYRKDQPSGCPVTLKDAGEMGVCDGNKANHAAIAAGETEICNLTPGKISKWWNTVDGNIKQSGTVKPTGTVRMIKCDSVNNIRDFGGWACDGGTVKYGKLFRGGRFNDTTGSLLSDVEINIFRNLLGIRAEIDMRMSTEGGALSESYLGSDVMYDGIVVGSIGADYSLFADIDGEYADEMKAILTTVFERVKYDLPTYIHCTHGADRTGTVAFILNGLLGVSQSDLDKDYELTSFYDLRSRAWQAYKNFVAYMKQCSTGTVRDCCVAYCAILGIPISEINAFRKNMIDGTPANVTENINYGCTGIILSADSGTMEGGATVTITATPKPSWTTNAITWKVADNSVATISANGKSCTITGVGSGTTTVTATCGSYSAIYTVTVKGELPSEYEAVAYIDHPDTANAIASTAYCDLGITGRRGLVIKGKTMAYATGDTYLAGSTDGTNRLLVGSSASYLGSTTGVTYGGSAVRAVTNTEVEFEFSTVVGNSYMKTTIPTASTVEFTEAINNSTAFDNGYNLFLFCRNNKGTGQRIYSGRLYWLTIEENGAEIMKLLPCRRKSDSVVGLYDTVGKRFITSANSVAFTAGT